MVDDVINSLCISSIVKEKIGSAAVFNIVYVWVAIKCRGENCQSSVTNPVLSIQPL